MSNKTGYGSYNEDNFVEIDGNLKELTVTITLCEYRNLITELERLNTANGDLYQKWKAEEERANVLCQALFVKSPELQNEVGDVIKSALDIIRADDKGDTEEGESDE